MLKALRNKSTQKKIYIVVAVAVVATFALSGIMLSTEKDPLSGSLGLLDGKKISVQDYLASYRAVERQFAMMFGENLGQMRKFINLKGEAWDRILLLNHARKEGIRVEDPAVVDWIAKQSAFQSNGRFDENAYKFYIQQAFGNDARRFEEEVRQMLTLQKVSDTLKSKVNLSDEDLVTLYTEERRVLDLQYGLLKIDETQEGLKTPEDTFKRLEELKAKVQNSDLAAALAAENLEVKTLEKLSRDLPPSDLGPSSDLLQRIRRLKENEVSDPLPVTGGAAIVKITKEYPVDLAKFAQEKETFKQESLNRKAGQAMNDLLNKLRNNLKMNLELMKELFPAEEKA